MSSYCWKVKALKSYGAIPQGAEVEIIIKDTNRAPSGTEIEKAYSTKYSIKAPSGVYGNKHIFEIIKP